MSTLLIVVGWILAGLGALYLVRVLRKRQHRHPAETLSPTESPVRRCPYCAATLQVDAAVCRSCGRELPLGDEAAKREQEFEHWLAEQQPPMRTLTASERKSYRQAFDAQFPPRA